LSTDAQVLFLEWDFEGECLAVLQEGVGSVPLWNLSSRSVTNLETNLQDPSFLKWSSTGPQLAIGTLKGNLIIYNKRSRKKIPILGKHPSKIGVGCWSPSNHLFLSSDDRSATFSDESGDTLVNKNLPGSPSQGLLIMLDCLFFYFFVD